MERCRVCLQKTTEISFSLKDIAPFQQIPYEEVYCYVTNVTSLDRGPQLLCWICTEELLAAYEFKKRCEKSEELFEKETSFVKTEFDEDMEEEVQTKIETDPDEYFMEHSPEENEKENTIQCPYCSLVMSSKGSKVNHCKLKHPEEKLKCTEENCSYEYFFSFQISTHMRKTHKKLQNDISFKCNDCSDTFTNESHLKRHRRMIHNIRKPYVHKKEKEMTICPHCGKVLSSQSLPSHLQFIHENQTETLVCDLCGATVKNRMNLVSHMKRRHMNQTFYNCRYCPEIFKNYATRRRHEIQFHTKAFRHTCHICKSQFIETTGLRKHMVTHTGDKNHVCTTCNTRFGTASALRRHHETHTDVKAYVCSICQAAFKTRKSLHSHANVHEERKYECPVCSQKFLINQQMRQHVIRNHPEYELPPPGTVMNKVARERMEKIELKKKILSLGMEKAE